MADIGIEGLEEIEPLEVPYFADIMNDNRQRDQKINEIAEKVNILIRMKSEELRVKLHSRTGR
jgi:hypothetical protein